MHGNKQRTIQNTKCIFSIAMKTCPHTRQDHKSQSLSIQFTLKTNRFGSVCPNRVCLFFSLAIIFSIKLVNYHPVEHGYFDRYDCMCVLSCARAASQPASQPNVNGIQLNARYKATHTSLSSTLSNYNRSIDHSRIFVCLFCTHQKWTWNQN